jgi:hypothetical protein
LTAISGGQAGHDLGLLGCGCLGPLRRLDRRGHLADPGAVLVLKLLHDRGAADQVLRVAARQQLQRRGQSDVHVALGCELADAELAGAEPDDVLGVSALRHLDLGARLVELDAEPVVLLVKRVDLVRERARLGDQALEIRHGLSHCRGAQATGENEAGHAGPPDQHDGLPPDAEGGGRWRRACRGSLWLCLAEGTCST